MSLKKKNHVDELSLIYNTEKVRTTQKGFKRVCCGKENDLSVDRRCKDEPRSVRKSHRKKRYLQEEVEKMLEQRSRVTKATTQKEEGTGQSQIEVLRGDLREMRDAIAKLTPEDSREKQARL